MRGRTVTVSKGKKVVLLFLCGLLAGAAAVPPRKGVKYPSPALVVEDASAVVSGWSSAFREVYRQLLRNLHRPRPPFSTRYAQPSPTYPAAYLWDTAFIAQVWKPWDVVTAMEVNRAVWSNAAPDGRLQHLVSTFGKSDYTQPPVMAWSVWENYLWSGKKEEVEAAYPALAAYNKWLYANRRLAGGLFFWLHPYESGIDNSPRFGSADESEVVDMEKLAAVDLNSYMVRQNETLASMAHLLGLKEDEERFRRQAEELKALVNELLWDEESGYYYDRDIAVDQLIKIRTIASLFPLFAGIPDEGRARRLRDHIMNPEEFNTPFPLPSVAWNDPAFEKDCWRGPVWINTAYLVIVGLERYGYYAEAAELSFKVADGVYRNFHLMGEFVEFYDPEMDGMSELHRKHGNLYKLITCGDKPRPNFVGWTGLANTIVIEHLIGFHRTPHRRWLAPRFPSSAAGVRFHLNLPQENLEIMLTVSETGGARGQIIASTGRKDFVLAFGEEMEIP